MNRLPLVTQWYSSSPNQRREPAFISQIKEGIREEGRNIEKGEVFLRGTLISNEVINNRKKLENRIKKELSTPVSYTRRENVSNMYAIQGVRRANNPDSKRHTPVIIKLHVDEATLKAWEINEYARRIGKWELNEHLIDLKHYWIIIKNVFKNKPIYALNKRILTNFVQYFDTKLGIQKYTPKVYHEIIVQIKRKGNNLSLENMPNSVMNHIHKNLNKNNSKSVRLTCRKLSRNKIKEYMKYINIAKVEIFAGQKEIKVTNVQHNIETIAKSKVNDSAFMILSQIISSILGVYKGSQQGLQYVKKYITPSYLKTEVNKILGFVVKKFIKNKTPFTKYLQYGSLGGALGGIAAVCGLNLIKYTIRKVAINRFVIEFKRVKLDVWKKYLLDLHKDTYLLTHKN